MLKKILLLSLLLLAPPLMAQEEAVFQDNVNYFEIFPSYPSAEKGKIEVMEFFWYNCPHCFDFEPQLQKWLETKPEDVNFVQVPAIFNKTARFHAETYYSLELMGKSHALQMKIFKAIHEDGKKLDDVEAMTAFIVEQGVDAETFRNYLKSFAVQTRVNRAEDLGKRFDITGVPNVVVNGTFRTGKTAGYEQMIQLIDFLIAKVREENGQAVAIK